MLATIYNAFLLAVDEAEPAAESNGFSQFLVLMLPVLVVMVVLQLFTGNTAGKDKKKREELIGSLKKNDAVVTVGGILGTFVSASEDKTEVTIRVDDNTRLKLQASAIREVLTKKSEPEVKS